MESISISEFKATCLKLLERIKNTGQDVIVTKKGEPIAIVSPPPSSINKRASFGCLKDQTQELGDIVSPLSDDDWEVLKS